MDKLCQSRKKYKLLPVGLDNFYELVSQNIYFVDKTQYIKKVIEDRSSVLILTRPRRFGKTLFMNMFADFLRINKDNPDDKEKTKALFKDTEIIKDKEFTEKYLGNFPVVNISLKKVFGANYLEAYKKLAELVAEKALELDYLNYSDKLLDKEKQNFQKIQDRAFLREIKNSDYLTSSIQTICDLLYKHYKRKVVVFIDEYDVPLAKAAVNGYHDEMVSLISSFLNFLKIEASITDGSIPIFKIIMTGCLKVAKNSIFTGVNNLKVNTVLDKDEKYTSIIGFNKAEVIKMLDDYDMSEYTDMVKENYDGYKFHKDEMFCPWDVVNFIDRNHQLVLNHEKEEVVAGNYWNNSSSASTTIIKEYVGFLSENVNEKLQSLVDGKTIDVSINDSMNYDSLSMHNADDFFSLLLHTGYLTSVGNPGKDIYSLKIPNAEIYDCFKRNIVAYFKEALVSTKENLADKLAVSLLNEDTDSAFEIIYDALQRYVSIRDFATKANKENFYHGFLSGIFSNCSKIIKEYKSNAEAGHGYADITFLNKLGSKAVVIELKVATDEDLVTAAEKAIEQIHNMKYTDVFKPVRTVKEVVCYGLSFNKKDCYLIKG